MIRPRIENECSGVSLLQYGFSTTLIEHPSASHTLQPAAKGIFRVNPKTLKLYNMRLNLMTCAFNLPVAELQLL